MMHKIVWCASSALVMLLPAAGMGQRQVPAPTFATTATPTPAESEVLSRPVSVTLDRVPLRQAVNAIAASAHVRIQYREELLAPFSSPVTLRADKTPLGDALKQVLSGTSLHAVPLDRDALVIAVDRSARQLADGVIVGVITDAKTKQPIVGATVTLDDANAGVKTDERGAFRIPTSAGAHRVVVRAIGYSRQVREITVTEGQDLSLTVALEPSASVLNEVIVTGTVIATERKAIPNPITVITAADIEKQGITRIEQLFRGQVPGVFILDRGAEALADGQLGAGVVSQVYSRGTSQMRSAGDGVPNPLKTYIDGVELLDPSYLGTIDPRTIERIEIITGPQAATIYGSGALGGVMQIFTKKGSGQTRPEIQLGLRYGVLQNSFSNGLTPAHDHSLALTGGAGPLFSYSGNVSYGYTGQWQPRLYARRMGVTGGVAHSQGRVSLSASVGGMFTQNGTSASSGVVMREWVLTGVLAPRNTADFGSSRVSESSSLNASVNADFKQSSWWQHHLTLGRSQTDLALIPQAPGFTGPADSLFNSAMSTGHRTSASYNTTLLPPNLGILSSTLTFGVNGSTGTQLQLTGCQATSVATTYVACSIYQDVSASRPIDTESWGGFTSLRVGLFDQLHVTLGLRGEKSPSYGRDHKTDWTPTNGVAYVLERGGITAKFMGSYGRATRAPANDQRREVVTNNTTYTLSTYVSQLANEQLTPEYSRGPQGGLELYFGNRASLTVNRYKQRISNLLILADVDTIWTTYASDPSSQARIVQRQWQNLAEVQQHGWETTGSLNLSSLTLRGTYSWTDSRVSKTTNKNSTIAYYFPVGASFKGVVTHMGNLTASYAHGGTSVTWVTNFTGKTLQQSVVLPMTDYEYYLNFVARLKMYTERARTSFGNYQNVVPGSARSDLLMSHRLTPSVSAMLNVLNVGDSYISDTSSPKMSPILGRQTTLGLSIRL